MKFEPMGTRILARQFDDDKIGEIIVPDQAKKVSLRATVIAVGPDVTWVDVGDTIIFGRYARFDLPLRDQKYKDWFVMNEEDIILRITEDKNQN